jgi:hypothetical protein
MAGSTDANSSFPLAKVNKNAKGITTDGSYLWVVNSAKKEDKVFKYTVGGQLLGSWTIDSENYDPTGITVDPSSPGEIWIVDAGSDQVFQYTGAAARISGKQTADSVFGLAAKNTEPQGIADPPPSALDAALASSATSQPERTSSATAGLRAFDEVDVASLGLARFQANNDRDKTEPVWLRHVDLVDLIMAEHG